MKALAYLALSSLKSYNFEPKAECYKTFSLSYLIKVHYSWSVCLCQAFPTQSNVYEQGQRLPD